MNAPVRTRAYTLYTEEGLTEKWSARKARREQAKAEFASPVSGLNGINYKMTPEKQRRLVALWGQKMSIKAIARDLDVGISSVSVWREKLGLPKKRVKPRTERLYVWLDAGMRTKIEQRIFGKYAYHGDYIRELLRRDLGL